MDKHGFTPEEAIAHEKLIEFREAYANLPVQHPAEQAEVDNAIHVIQGTLAIRVLRRDYPKGWPTYSTEDGNHEVVVDVKPRDRKHSNCANYDKVPVGGVFGCKNNIVSTVASCTKCNIYNHNGNEIK